MRKASKMQNVTSGHTIKKKTILTTDSHSQNSEQYIYLLIWCCIKDSKLNKNKFEKNQLPDLLLCYLSMKKQKCKVTCAQLSKDAGIQAYGIQELVVL